MTTSKPDPLEQVLDFSDISEADFNAPPDPDELAEFQAEIDAEIDAHKRHSIADYDRDRKLIEQEDDLRHKREAILSQQCAIFEDIDTSELLESDEEINYLVNGLVVRGEYGGIVGPFKGCKTTSAIELVMSVIYGFPFLGHFEIPRPWAIRKAAFFSGALGPPTVARIVRHIAKANGIQPDDWRHKLIRWEFHLPNLRSKEQRAALRAFIEKHSLCVVIIDSLYFAMDGLNATSPFGAGKYLRHLVDISRETDCAVLVVHHSLKETASSYQPLKLKDVSGAGIAESFRQWLLISRRLPFDERAAKPEHHLWMSYGGSAGHYGLCGVDLSEAGDGWSSRVLTVEEANEADGATKTTGRLDRRSATARGASAARRQKLLDALAGAPAGLTVRDLRTAAGMNTKTSEAVLDELVVEGLVQPVKIAKGNRQEYDGFALAQRAEPPEKT